MTARRDKESSDALDQHKSLWEPDAEKTKELQAKLFQGLPPGAHHFL
jgi:hypothetical protein